MQNKTGFDDSRTAWISRGFEQLARKAANSGTKPEYDVVVVGSGYGGAVAAATFAGCRHQADDSAPVSICVLERGREYLSGAFPNGLTEIPTHVRMESRKSGLFDVRLGPEVCTVIANGLGGGSLVNAGVMEVPAPEVFASHWPEELSDRASLDPYYERAKQLLGAAQDGVDNTIERHPDGLPRKFTSIRGLSPRPGDFRPAAITVAMDVSSSSAGVALNKCIRCGDCATGCNHGAKNSLDVNLLVRAHVAGAEIYSGATVLTIRRHDSDPVWVVSTVYTDAKLRARHGEPVQIHATNVVLAAGTLGSTEILKRSATDQLHFSSLLGRRCSTNGDMLITDYDTDSEVHAVADETVRPSDRAVGPTITGVMDLRDKHGLVIEEMAVPSGLRRAFTEIFTTANALHSLSESDSSTHRDGIPDADIYAANPDRIERSALYAVMGDDGAGGHIELQGELNEARDGIARIRWEGLQKRPLFKQQVEVLSELTRDTKGRILPNPGWKLLPADMSSLINHREGPLLTVHPLGGCTMADSAEYGVVNGICEVFNPLASVTDVHAGLVVLDGAVIPTALGTNPALTIAAVALRAAESLAAKWRYVESGNRNWNAEADPLDRPVFREADHAYRPEPTRVELNERMSGPVTFTDAAGRERQCVVELTLRSEDKAIVEWIYPPAHGGDPELRVDDRQTGAMTDSRIRIYDYDKWRRINLKQFAPLTMERCLGAICLYQAPLSGSLRVLERGRSRALYRLLSAGWAWIWNRGLRDTWEAVLEGKGGPTLWARFKSGLALATRAGEMRLIKYELRIGDARPGCELELGGDRISGTKRFTYNRRANPWTQLMEMSLEQFPGLHRTKPRPDLTLDLAFLGRIGVPLFRIKRQADGVTALAELASFLGYFTRLLIGIHVWSFRSPDDETRAREPVRLPGELPGMPAPEIHELYLGDEVPDYADNTAPLPVKVRLTRYARPESPHPPILMIHGYSASGTTFAHPSVDPNFASYFWQREHDVWIIDMRTSSGMATASAPWSFEQAARRDIPAACHLIHQETGNQIDVVAHCMGAAMFSMAVLHAAEPRLPGETFLQEQARHDLSGIVRRVAFTQVGPLVVFTPMNVFRGYVARQLLEFLPDNYTFRPGPDASLADSLLDRLLSTVPYPKQEFDIENPPWPPWRRTPWVRTRHRMDALYGRDFNVTNLGQDVLDHIDDHFGPMSIKTVTQTIHFSRYNMITDKAGRNTFVWRSLFAETWRFPTLSIHAFHNGLSDVATVSRMKDVLSNAGRVFDYEIVGREENAGHQDALIGRPRHQTFDSVERFFRAESPGSPHDPIQHLKAYPPWIGPIVTTCTNPSPRPQGQSSSRYVRFGTRPTHREPAGAALLRVKVDGNGFRRPDDQPFDTEYIRHNMIVVTSRSLQDDGWTTFRMPETSAASRFPGNGVLVLVVYDESDLAGPVETAYKLRYAEDSDSNYFQYDPAGRTWVRRSVPPLDWDPVLTAQSASGTTLPETMAPAENDASAMLIEHTVDAVMRELVDRPAGLMVLPDHEPADDHRNILDIPLEIGYRDETGGMTRIGYEEDSDRMHGYIPDPPPDGAAFALMSCQYPANFLDGPVAYEAYRHVLDRIDNSRGITPRFMIMTGDQVYVDATAGLYDPSQRDDRYKRPYISWLRDEDVRGVLRRVPSFMMMDDHEIADNWEPAIQGAGNNQELRDRGRESYIKYQRGSISGSRLSFEFSHGEMRFFMLDTRTERELRNASNVESRSMIDPEDLARLEAWLHECDGPKFIVSPAMLLPRHRCSVQWKQAASALNSDGWDGYPDTLYKVLELITRTDIQHVVFLSGNEHRGCVATIDITNAGSGKVARTHSIHTQGAYTPFPFANRLEQDFVTTEQFTFTGESGESYTCAVDAVIRPPENSVTYLNPRLDNGAWKLDYQFGDDTVQTIDI